VITCRELIDFLMGYLDGELPPEARAEFERHLAICPPCVRYIKTYQETVALEKGAWREPEAALTDAPEELIKAILAARQKLS
jgi:anti-sigma factor RsiW